MFICVSIKNINKKRKKIVRERKKVNREKKTHFLIGKTIIDGKTNVGYE